MSDDVVEVRCAACGTRNRVSARRIAEQPRCGRCKGAVFPDRPVPGGDPSFADEVLASPIPVLVDFWAP